MIDCEKCKYYHDNCDSKFRCRIDVDKIRADAIDECIAEINKQFKDGYGFGVTVYPHTICNILEQLKEKKNE